jgi:hypothetical protein
MIDAIHFDQYIFADGKIVSVAFDYADKTIEMKLQIRKRAKKKYLPCSILIRFRDVIEVDVLENFSTSGNYSDIVLVNQSDNQVYASFDPFGNSGQPDERDNFVIRAADCEFQEVK